VSPIRQLITGEAGSEYIIDGAVKNINEDAPKTLNEEVLLTGATAISDEALQIDWKLYTLSKDELDLEQAEIILRENYIQPALEEGSIFGIWKKHSITITYSITDKDDIHLFDIAFGPDDY
jgi:hypothetical protein